MAVIGALHHGNQTTSCNAIRATTKQAVTPSHQPLNTYPTVIQCCPIGSYTTKCYHNMCDVINYKTATQQPQMLFESLICFEDNNTCTLQITRLGCVANMATTHNSTLSWVAFMAVTPAAHDIRSIAVDYGAMPPWQLHSCIYTTIQH